jgi:plasmid stabilization system protein ParE
VPYTVITTIHARRDIQDAIDWENMRKPGLADYFLKDLNKKMLTVSRSPYIFAVRYKNVHCAGTDVFSYLIHYTINDDKNEVTILRILHTSRNPIW